MSLNRTLWKYHITYNQVIEIMKFSLWDTYEDSAGGLDFQRAVHGSGSSKRGELKRFIATLSRHSHASGNKTYTWDSLQQIAAEVGVQSPFADLIDTLNHQGYLLKKANRLYDITI